MKLNADIIFENLAERFSVKRMGSNIKTLSLSSPIFYYGDTRYQNDRVYVGRAGELPQPPRDISCLIICVGGSLPKSWNPGCCSVFIVTDEMDILRIFNILQMTFDRYYQWSLQLREILDSTASIEEMIRITAPIFGNPISLCNNRLEILAVSDPGGNADISSVGPVPEKQIQHFLNRHEQNTSMRRPFVYEMDGYSTYCINIYKQDTYLGLITMGDMNHAFRPGDFELFECFFEFVSAATEKQLNSVGGEFVTLKSVFRDLLSSLPVSGSLIRKALRKGALEDGRWQCAAVKLAGNAEILPSGYLCTMLESRLPAAIAIHIDSYIAVFMSVREDESNEAGYFKAFEYILKDMSLCAGVSYRFADITKARYYFRQAVTAIETAISYSREDTLCHLKDYALLYALQNSVGEFPVEYIVPEALLRLREKDESPGSADYWKTLKVYLDNEMNATETARALFIHRTTLQTRLSKIRETVDLNTPQSRLYVRYCIYLYEAFTISEE